MTRQPLPPDIMGDVLNNASGAAVDVPLGFIDDNPFQERTDYGDLTDLANDIREHGLLQPPMVRQTPDGRYQLAFGHRRKRACELANMTAMPVLVRAIDDERMATIAYSENEQRLDVTAIDRARSIQKMQQQFNWTQQQIADKLSISRPTVANLLRLLRLPDDLQAKAAKGVISARQAEALISVVELPKDIRDKAERFWSDYTKPSEIIRDAISGASSDSIRKRTQDLLLAFTQTVHEEPWYRHSLDGEFQASSCDQCPVAIKRDTGVYCPVAACFEGKKSQWFRMQLLDASQLSGIPIADSPVYSYAQHESFQYEANGPAVLAATPPCKNLRLVVSELDRTIRNWKPLAGFPQAFVVCQKAGNNQCLCLSRMKREKESANPSKTKPAVLKREIIAPAADLLATELAKLPPGLLRIMMNQVQENRSEDGPWLIAYGATDEELALKQAEIILKWHCSDWKSPETNRGMAAGILEFAGLPSPWPEAS